MMGITVKLFCGKCGCHRLFFLGFGFNHDSRYIFYDSMCNLRLMVESPQERVNIRGIMFSHPDAKVLESECRIYYCPYCGNLHENYYFKINYGNGEYSPRYYCSRCETELELLDTNWSTVCSNEPLQFFNCKGMPIKLSCPDCGRGKMRCADGSIDWD